MATELSTIEKRAVDALLAAWARFANQSPFDGEGFSAFARRTPVGGHPTGVAAGSDAGARRKSPRGHVDRESKHPA